ncbi:MAG: RNA polymerase sigma factor [Bacteroidia bacterium]
MNLSHSTISQLYHEYQKLVFNLALHYVQRIEDAEEITQDVFLAIHESIGQFQQKAQLSTWIYRITINKSLDFIKAQRRKKRFGFLTSLFFEETGEERYPLLSFDHPGYALEQKEALSNIFNQINVLPDKQKTALILMKIESKSQVETAEIMGVSPKAVESLVQRAKTNLAKNLVHAEGKAN